VGRTFRSVAVGREARVLRGTGTRRPGRLNLSREGCASLLVGGHSGLKAAAFIP